MSKLTDKAKGISFDDVDEPTPGLPADRPRTAIGAISASIAMGRGVEAENRELRAKLEHFEDATVVELLDPKRINLFPLCENRRMLICFCFMDVNG